MYKLIDLMGDDEIKWLKQLLKAEKLRAKNESSPTDLERAKVWLKIVKQIDQLVVL